MTNKATTEDMPITAQRRVHRKVLPDGFKGQISDGPGEVRWIPKNQLSIDSSYQREVINHEVIGAIASDWKWPSCGALVVSLRPDGSCKIIDGQNRWLAAMKIPAIESLPCLVFQIGSIDEEAAAFIALNNLRTSVTGIAKFKALLIAKNEAAIAVMAIVTKSGKRVSRQRGKDDIRCPIVLWRLFQENEERLRRLWPLLCDMHHESQITETVIKALWGVEKRCCESRKLSLTDDPFKNVLVGSTGEYIRSVVIRREYRMLGSTITRISINAVIKYLNSEIRLKQFTLDLIL